MPVSSLVVTMSDDPSARRALRRRLADDPRIQVGDPQRNQLPVVLETETIAEGVSMTRDELYALDGVEFVHVVRVDFEDVEDFDEKLPPRHRRGAD